MCTFVEGILHQRIQCGPRRSLCQGMFVAGGIGTTFLKRSLDTSMALWESCSMVASVGAFRKVLGRVLACSTPGTLTGILLGGHSMGPGWRRPEAWLSGMPSSQHILTLGARQILRIPGFSSPGKPGLIAYGEWVFLRVLHDDAIRAAPSRTTTTTDLWFRKGSAAPAGSRSFSVRETMQRDIVANYVWLQSEPCVTRHVLLISSRRDRFAKPVGEIIAC